MQPRFSRFSTDDEISDLKSCVIFPFLTSRFSASSVDVLCLLIYSPTSGTLININISLYIPLMIKTQQSVFYAFDGARHQYFIP